MEMKKAPHYSELFLSLSLEVQQNGLNFIYDMQNCSTSQFDVNLSKKILKLLQVFSRWIKNFLESC